MIIAGTRVLITREGQLTMCYGCDEQGYLNQDCPRRTQTGTQRGDTYTHSWGNVVTQGPMRQETATMSDTIPSQQSIHEVGMTDILTELPSRQEDHSAPANTADGESRMDTQTMDMEEPVTQLSIKQPCEKEDVNDKSCDIETLESPTTTMVTDGRIREKPIEDMGSRATTMEREDGTGKSSVYKRDKTIELSPVEEESLA